MSKLQRIAAVVISLYLLLVLIDRFVLVELFVSRAGFSMLAALFEALAIIGAGFAIRGAFERNWDIARIDLPREFLLGYPLFGAACFLLGTLNISALSMGLFLAVSGVGGLYIVVRRFELRLPRIPDFGDPFALVVIAAVFLCAFISAQAPPVSLDELAYHLAVPWTWVTEHRAIDLPLISHSYFPLGIESADLPLLATLGQIRGGIASHFLHLGAAVAATLALFRLAKGNVLAVAAIVATPALALMAGWSLVDWPLIGICALLVLALDDGDITTLTMAIAAGLLTKYTFIPFAIIALIVARRWRGVLSGLAIGSIFFVRNLILTANPIAPFLSAAAPHVSGYRAAFLSDYVFDGRFIDESLGASLLAACTLSGGMLAWVLIAAAVLLFLLAPSSRILLPFLAIPAARSTRPTPLIRIVMTFAIVVQLLLIGYFVERGETFSLLSGTASDEQFLAKHRASFPAAEATDALLPDNARVLVVGLNEMFWFTHRVRGGGNFDGPRVSQYLEAPAPEALHARLKKDGVTHVAVVSPPPPATAVEEKLAERDTALTPRAQRMLAQTLDRYTSNVVQRGAAVVFTLK
jgi:hypothetical protein